MQVNPKVEYNEEDAGLSLENEFKEPTAEHESNDAQDEADLSAAEEHQKDVAVKGTQVISSPRGVKYSRIDDKVIVAGSMAAGVASVIIIYALVVFL